MFFLSATKPAETVTDALRQASAQTGVGFDYLLRTAQRESGLQPDAQAASSSARGLFQFVEQTWLETLKEEGPKYGFGALSEQIERQPNGRFSVGDDEARTAIMRLRDDPELSAVMAGALTRRNAAQLEANIGRTPSAGELYIAHFLGAGSGANLIRAAEQAPQTPAADLFPQAAQANRTIFFNKNGTPRSVDDVYSGLVAKHDSAAGPIIRAARQVEEKLSNLFASLFQIGARQQEAVTTPQQFLAAGRQAGDRHAIDRPFAWMQQEFDPAAENTAIAQVNNVAEAVPAKPLRQRVSALADQRLESEPQPMAAHAVRDEVVLGREPDPALPVPPDGPGLFGWWLNSHVSYMEQADRSEQSDAAAPGLRA